MMTIETKIGEVHALDRCGIDPDRPMTSDHWDFAKCDKRFEDKFTDARTFWHGEGDPTCAACLRALKK